MYGKKGSGKAKNSHDMVNPRNVSGVGSKVGNQGKSMSVTGKKGVKRTVSVRAKRG